MKLINRFLLHHFLRILLLSCAAFIGIYLLIDFFEKIGDFIDYKAGAADYLSYLLNSVPLILVQILPLAILMTVVLTLGGLGRTNETTALRACGISLWKIVQPFMTLALLLSVGLLLLNEFICPYNAKALHQLLEVKLKGRQAADLRNDEIWYRHGGRILNIIAVDARKRELHGLTAFDIDADADIVQRLEAPLVRFEEGRWVAPQLTVRRFDPQTGDLLDTETTLNQPLVTGRTPSEFAVREHRSEELGIRQLWRKIRKLEKEGFDPTRHRVDLHQRLAAPFTCLIMAFLGVPFALQRGRRSNIALGIGLSLGIGVIYFIIQSLMVAFGYSGAVPPALAAWSSNLIFLMFGVWLLLSVRE